MPKRLLFLAPLLAGCASYECADTTVMGYALREECGPFGAFGFLYFEDQMVRTIFDSSVEDFLTEESDFVFTYLPAFSVHFWSGNLQEGTVIPFEHLTGTCSRTAGVGTGVYFWPLTDGEIEILGPSDRTFTGGQSWRMRWRYECAGDADMFTSGEDVIELDVEATGYDFELFGTPGDYPTEWE